MFLSRSKHNEPLIINWPQKALKQQQMNVILLRQIISAIDEHKISDKWIENLTIETTADVEKAVLDWQEIRNQATDQMDAQATADISAWAASRTNV